ncbi:MAG: acyl-CoA dehydrogenase family protein [Acidimicrobiia bacterium]|nr:acyl-CoA dehydrogenase family protein [Acidimicrobiia bacterium]MBT8214244.1 acyl-CoA dehydrogenase family protein [Acidimicrobiia bacterium]
MTDVSALVEQLLAENDPTDREAFMRAQFAMGLAWVHFPEGKGGLGLAPRVQHDVDAALEAAGAPLPRFVDVIGHGMGAPTLLAHGTEEQQSRYLEPLFTGEEIWSQLFSEPGAGSDVAGLATRAIKDGDEWVVSGQKVWTTVAHLSKWGMVVTRTDPDVPKHLGMTYFLMDMEADGVDIRPLRQITGEAEFNEVYMTDVRIPDANRIGGVGEGWRVALTTLMNERVAIGGGVGPRGSGPISDLVDVFAQRGGHDAARDKVMKLWTEAEAARLTNLRAFHNRDAGTPGPEGSTAKLHYAELNKRIYELATELLGAEAMLYDTYEFIQPETPDDVREDIRRRFLRTRANSIEGGTSEIMRNIIGERVLGLPGEPRVDKELPWTQVPRS